MPLLGSRGARAACEDAARKWFESRYDCRAPSSVIALALVSVFVMLLVSLAVSLCALLRRLGAQLASIL